MSLNLLVAQINPIVGDIASNSLSILNIIKKHADNHDLILFPELALSGYPPEDLLFYQDFHTQIEDALKDIQKAAPNCHVIVGHPEKQGDFIFNAATLFYKNKRYVRYHKQKLPNEGVFDEKRYFTEGEKRPGIFTLKNIRCGICICEDLWHQEPINQFLQADVQLILALNASPFYQEKYSERVNLLTKISKKGLSIVYANLVGGQDELLFDGASMCFDNLGSLKAQAAVFTEDLLSISIDGHNIKSIKEQLPDKYALLYQALVTATKDYVHKSGHSEALIGLSGGIDSALTLAIAVDALGCDKVTAVCMPSRYTAKISLIDAELLIKALKVKSHTISIEPSFKTMLETLSPVFAGFAPNIAEENLQARLRALILLGISNKTGALILTTSNKSEIAMGYGTIYGDMAGAFNVLKDVYKTEVYELTKYRNKIDAVIPERILTRAPSAELAFNQKDQDTLPPYDRLDKILKEIIENHASVTTLTSKGFAKQEVIQILQTIKRNEFKRRQAPPGPKVSKIAFGRDWRFPICKNIIVPA